MNRTADKETIIHTSKHDLRMQCYYDVVDATAVTVNKPLFTKMCEQGCSNYNNKHCCPPHTPEFSCHVGSYRRLLLVMARIEIDQLAATTYNEYHKVRMTNTIIKSRIEKVMRSLEKSSGTKFMSTGACRLCKPCQKKIGKTCKHPQEMRFSLEALGADCNRLAEEVFGMPLLWYKEKHAPEYTAVICALPLKEEHEKEEFYKLLEETISNIK